MKESANVSSNTEEEELIEISWFELLKGYLSFLYRNFIRP